MIANTFQLRRTWLYSWSVRAVLVLTVRWTFIYFISAWIDSEHLQRAGTARAKLTCVYTLCRLREESATGEMRQRALLPIKKHLAVSVHAWRKNPETNPLLFRTPSLPRFSTLQVFLNHSSIIFQVTELIMAVDQQWLKFYSRSPLARSGLLVVIYLQIDRVCRAPANTDS